MKGFSDVSVGPTLRTSFQNLVMSSGLGGMKPNTVVLQFYKYQPKVSTSITTKQNRRMNKPKERMNHDISKLEEIDKLIQDFGWEVDTNQQHNNRDTFSSFNDTLASQQILGMINFCFMINDSLAFEKNVIVTRHFELLDKSSIVRYAKEVRKRTSEYVKQQTIDIWSTDERDWDDPSGTLALQLQLAFGLHRTDIWEDNTKLRVVAACISVKGTNTEADKLALENAKSRLLKLLNALRVEAEVLVLPSVGAALFEYPTETVSDDIQGEDTSGIEMAHRVKPSSFVSIEDDGNDNTSQPFWIKQEHKKESTLDNAAHGPKSNQIEEAAKDGANMQQTRGKWRPLTQLEHCAELNTLVSKSSGIRATVVFLPLPLPPLVPHEENAKTYIENLKCLTLGLPPCILVAPGQNQDVVTTEI